METTGEWMMQDRASQDATANASDGSVSVDQPGWHPASLTVENVINQGLELL